MIRVSIALATVASLLVLAASALGQGAPRPDPDSPAGVEYQLPLDRAREEASGGGSVEERSSRRAGEGAPLFGVGVAGARAASTGGGESSDGGGGVGEAAPGGGTARSKGSSGNPDRDADAQTPGVRRTSLAASGDSDGGGGDLRTGLIIAAVLGAGLALGLVLRRGLRDTSS